MPAGLPHARMCDDGPFDPHDIVIDLHHRPPPVAADIIAQFNAQRPEIIDARDPAINLRVGVNKASSLTQRNDLLNRNKWSVFRGQRCYVLCLCHEWIPLYPPQKNSPGVSTITPRDEY